MFLVYICTCITCTTRYLIITSVIIGIPLPGLMLPNVCAGPKPGTGFPDPDLFSIQ